ncbi:hypothetical protein AYR62_14925 [Secundilactobacillus paracollinoides]|uniref:L,D-transpeptidase family protein n=1 Tax=Secundilactobacillus paracollinoides TaxID=240427 RepID=UPI00081AA875|nr:L,D-transpeptidase family protein [Secundilactobacillus paracollinoides]ANZ65242.1 hypothetical protein AYR62_14925 [Secundilactobacillus paracollinoides]
MARKRRTTKHSATKKWVLIGLIALIVVGAGGAVGYASYYNQRFKPAKINGITVTNMTASQAADKINNSDSTTSSNTIAVSKSKINVSTATVNKLLQKRNNDGHALETVSLKVANTVSASDYNYRINTLLPAFKSEIETINANRTTPVNAKVTYADGKTTVTKSQNGTALDEATMVKSFKEQAKTDLEIDVKKTIDTPVKADSSAIKTTETNLKSLLNRTVNVTYGSTTWHFKASDYLKSVTASVDGKYTYDSSTLATEIAKLANEHDTKGKSFSYKTHSGTTIKTKVGSSTYGWSIEQTKLKTAILAAFEKSGTQTLNLKNYVSGLGYGKSGVGGTLVEVDLKTLEEYAYVNNKLVFSTPVMSGTVTGSDKTPQGVFYVLYKQRNATLRGENDNGTSYASKVKYWMPFTEDGVGLHDSSWQPSSVYGNVSDRSEYHSHGCINNPPSKIKALWEVVSTNEPVVVYY